MKIVIAPDSFKGSLRAVEVCRIWREAFAAAAPGATLVCLPMSDGGEGALEALQFSTGARLVACEAEDALGRGIRSLYALLEEGNAAFIETAAASGLELIGAHERNPMKASSYGVGQLIAAALAAGARQLTIAIGGVATVDGGLGMLQALGFRFLDAAGAPVGRGGAALAQVASIDVSQANPLLREASVAIASDVTNPLTGPTGAAAVFGPQKGATPEMVVELEAGLAHFAEVAIASGLASDCSQPGDGAAGGLGFALRTFLRAKMGSGAVLMAGLMHLREHLRGADYLITGEGRSDAQTAFGKLPAAVAGIASEAGVPAILCSGAIEDAEALRGLFLASFSALRSVQPLEEAMRDSAQNLYATAYSIASLLRQGEK